MTDRRDFLGTLALGGVAMVVPLGLAQERGCTYVYAGG